MPSDIQTASGREVPTQPALSRPATNASVTFSTAAGVCVCVCVCVGWFGGYTGLQ